MSRHKKRAAKSHLDIVPFGKVDTLATSVLAANLQALIGLNADILPPLSEPEYAFIPLRSQYSAGKILNELESLGESGKLKLGVIHLDICTPILKFVFGESQLGGKAAVISLHRLVHDKPQRTYERTAKIGLHETGHMLGIGHCRAPGCLMAFSSSIEKLDGIPLRFCDACQYEISRTLRYTFGQT